MRYTPRMPARRRDPAAAGQHAQQAAAQGADLLVCPEMGLTGYAIGAERVSALAETADGPMAQAVAAIAQRHQIAIVYGYPEQHPEGQKPFNAAQAIDHQGRSIGHYRKTHLFGDMDRQQFTAGDTASHVFGFQGWRLGLLICYDVEFPEPSRRSHCKAPMLCWCPRPTWWDSTKCPACWSRPRLREPGVCGLRQCLRAGAPPQLRRAQHRGAGRRHTAGQRWSSNRNLAGHAGPVCPGRSKALIPVGLAPTNICSCPDTTSRVLTPPLLRHRRGLNQGAWSPDTQISARPGACARMKSSTRGVWMLVYSELSPSPQPSTEPDEVIPTTPAGPPMPR